ncbi:retrotransposon protein, putative, ty1-copia subclass [Tanacetum coccineum]
MFVIKQPIPLAPAADSKVNVLAEWNAIYDAHNEKQAGVERFDLIQTFHACKQEEGKHVGTYVLKIKDYMEQLERLGYVFPRDLSVCLILNGLTSDFAGFVRNYNMHNMGKTIGEIHALLIEYEKGYLKSTKRSKHNLDSTYLWHYRLAHISKKCIEKLQQEGLLKSTDDESFDQCVSCLSGKMTRKLFPHRPERATDLLGIIHTDVCGPLRHVSRQGASYFITFTDDYSRYGYVYLLKHKHEVFETLKVFKNKVENQLGKTIKAFRSDRGGEYISQEFKDYLKACGIVQQLTPQYTPQHNRVFEMRNCTLLDMGCEALVKRDTPDKLQQRSVKGRAMDLEEIQDEDTSPSEITSKIPMEVEGFEPPQEEVILINAMNAEIQSMIDNTVWVLVDLPPGCKTVGRNHIPSLQSVKEYLGKCFAMKDLGEAVFILGIKIYRDMSKRLIGLKRLDLNKTQGALTPEEVKRMQNVPYASDVGSIMYAVRCTRPDVAFANTKDMFLFYGGNPEAELRFDCYCDAGFETDRDDIKSETGYVFVLNGGAVDWKSSKQSTTAMSATKAEYIAASEAAMEAVWIMKFISGLGARHYHRRYHYVRECIELGKINLLKVYTYDNLADPFTKEPQRKAFRYDGDLRELLEDRRLHVLKSSSTAGEKAFAVCAGTAQIEDDLLEIRKKKRDEILHSKRQLRHPSTILLEKKFERMYPIVYKLYSNDNSMQLEAAIEFSKVLRTGVQNPPVEKVAYMGVIPRFVEFLMRDDFPELQLQAVGALINITSGTSEIIKAVVDNGAVPSLVKLLDSPSDDMREEAIWVLGNIAADSSWSRDIVLDQGALQPLLAQSDEHARLSMLRTVASTLSSLCSGTPPPTLAKIHTALPVLARFTNSSCDEILACACCSLSRLTVKKHMIQPIIDAGVEYGLSQRLVQHIGHCCSSVRTPAIATVMNIVDRSPHHVQALIDFGALPFLLNVITSKFGTNVGKENACWTVAHIASENENRVQSVIKAGLIPPIVKLLRTADVDLLKAVVTVIFHVTAKGSNEHVRFRSGLADLKAELKADAARQQAESIR